MAPDDNPPGSAAVSPLGDVPAAPAETEYLDLDGDGVPDAVRTTRTAEYDLAEGPDIVETVVELDRDIDDDGRPRAIEWVDAISVDADRDGTPELIDLTSLEVRTSDET